MFVWSGKTLWEYDATLLQMALNQSTDTVIEQQVIEHNDNLELYLSQIGKIFDIPRMMNEPQGSSKSLIITSVANYLI